MTAEPAVGYTAPRFPAQVSVRVDRDRAPEAAGRALPAPNAWSTLPDGRESLGLGPDEWLFVGPAGSQAEMVNELGTILAGMHHSVVDVSANRAVFDVIGRDRGDLLAKGCGLDMHPRSWRAGLCAQTLLARVPVIVQERADATRVFVRPSFAGYLLAWFDDASR